MLKLKNIKKKYEVGDIVTVALDDISLEFREREFVAILGTSGSGKTTALNIIGGLDRYDSGDLIIKGKHTKDFKESDWDAYRNNSIGFVFQSYNLINHLSIVANVELGMTLSGVSNSEKKERALSVLERVGLREHLHKKPNQLSGGQQQRVAIARALANDPEILLCDEPTGALDSTTSTEIMDLIKEVASDKLVIMVTHNPELAHEYANRIVEFKDGKIIADSNPYKSDDKEDRFSLKKTSMSFFTALRLSFNNIATKKGRTFLTSFASSIGIIGIAVILSLSTGFQRQIDNFQEDALSEFPIIISNQSMTVDPEVLQEQSNAGPLGKLEFVDSDYATLYNPTDTSLLHNNILSKEFTDYVDKMDPQYASSIGYTYLYNLNLIRDVDGTYESVSIKKEGMSQGINTIPLNLNPDQESYLEKSYDLLAGDAPEDMNDLVLVVDHQNRIDQTLLENLGFDIEDMETIKFDDLVGTEVMWIPNDAYYEKSDFGNYLPNKDLNKMSEHGVKLRISAVIRQKEDAKITLLDTGIVYSDQLSKMMVDNAMNSKIAIDQRDSEVNVLSLQSFESDMEKEQFMAYIGASDRPFMISVYPKDFESKDEVLAYLDAYNVGKAEEDLVIYTDMASMMSELTKGIMDGITIVLIAFASISLVVSLIMIGIITYTSVLERTKEIGVLKALGARKKDITRVFDAETFILGVFSGTLGVTIAFLLTIPINVVINNISGLNHVAQLQATHALTLVVISTLLTVLGGHIPAKMASKKDAVEALRSE